MQSGTGWNGCVRNMYSTVHLYQTVQMFGTNGAIRLFLEPNGHRAFWYPRVCPMVHSILVVVTVSLIRHTSFFLWAGVIN